MLVADPSAPGANSNPNHVLRFQFSSPDPAARDPVPPSELLLRGTYLNARNQEKKGTLTTGDNATYDIVLKLEHLDSAAAARFYQ
jgi:hypothetical protein